MPGGVWQYAQLLRPYIGVGRAAGEKYMNGRRGKIFVLVHGSFHGAWAFGKLAPLLMEGGHQVIARDLPGHGLEARFPRAYLEHPPDPEKLATDPSPLGEVGLKDCADQVTADVRRVAERFPGSEIVLVGHSFGGLVLNSVGEAVPDLLGRLVYLSAYMAASGKAAGDYLAGSEFASSELWQIAVADPAVIGAFRINPRSADPAYRAKLKDALAADVDEDAWTAAANLLTSDAPGPPHAEPVTTTGGRWGAIPRTYISCVADKAFPRAVQERFISDADAFTPDNRTDVHELAASHSAYWSQPEKLARILLGL